MKLDEVYVITLAREPVGWERARGEFEKEGMRASKVSAVDASNLDDDYYRKNCTRRCSMLCTDKMVAIAASHMKCWTTMLKSGYDAVLVAEDDVILHRGIKEKIDNLVVPKDWDVIYLGCFGCEETGPTAYFQLFSLFTGKPERAGFKLNKDLHVPQVALGTHCYLVSRKGAETLLSLFERNIDDHVDIQMQKFSARGLLKTYAVSPLLSSQTSSQKFTGFPRLLNASIDGYYASKNQDIALNFCLSTPGAVVFGYPVNVWTTTFVIAAAVCGIYQVKFTVITVVMLLILTPELIRKELNFVIIALISMYVSYKAVRLRS